MGLLMQFLASKDRRKIKPSTPPSTHPPFRRIALPETPKNKALHTRRRVHHSWMLTAFCTPSLPTQEPPRILY
jgi:hypothetical protein